MIRIAILILASICSTTFAQNAPATQPTTQPVRVNRAIVPALNQRFTARHQAFLEDIKNNADAQILFMGDSITDAWRSTGRPDPNLTAIPFGGKPVFDKYFGDMKVLNLGIGGDSTQGVLWRLQNGEATGYTPKAVMLMIGTNNTGGSSAEEIATGVSAIVCEMRKAWPEAKILLLAIFPRSDPGNPVRDKIARINQIIQALHDEQHVWYMDIGDKFLAPDGTIPTEIMNDKLHPTSKGYEIWAEAVKPTLVKLAE